MSKINSENRKLFPLYFDLSSKCAAVIGEDENAAEIKRILQICTGRVMQITPSDYKRDLLYGCDLVISFSDDRKLNSEIHAACRTLGILLHIAAEPAKCDFFLSQELLTGKM